MRTNEVQVNVVVRDFKGNPIGGLKASDFRVFDEGKQQNISGFSELSRSSVTASAFSQRPDTNHPGESRPSAQTPRRQSYIAMFFDDVNTQQLDLASTLSAARKFIRESPDTTAYFGIFTSSGTINADYTRDKTKLDDSLSRIRLHPRYSFKSEEGCIFIRVYETYLIAEANDLNELREAANCYGSPVVGTSSVAVRTRAPSGNSTSGDSGPPDQSYMGTRVQANQIWFNARVAFLDTLSAMESAVQSLAAKPGKRIVLITSAGFISEPMQHEKDRIVGKALRAGVVINSLDSKGLYSELPGSPLDELNSATSDQQRVHQVESLGPRIEFNNSVMSELADATGGEFIHNSNDFLGGFRKLAVEPQVSYLVSFVPSAEANDGKFHKLNVRLTPPAKGSVQSRAGYFALTKEEAARPSPEQELDREVGAADSPAEFPATVTSRAVASADKSTELSVTIHVDLRALEFQPQKDRQVQQLNFVVALFDLRGNFVAGKQGEIDLALKPDSFARLESSGVNGSLNLDAPPGSYRLRVVTQEAVNGKL
ncbi:MAG TPA: VWA domain-containing protein, partial [Candidatus Acidoferrales bacterium]|nr:VWA domain-containing protein [Candidatus Acidoferrales bacterium]